MTSYLLWMDLEATGSKNEDPILEHGTIVTTADYPFTEVATLSGFCKPTDPEWEQGMKDVVREMHTKNGLLDDVRSSATTLADLEDEIIETLASIGKRGDFEYAGSGVGHYDRRMVRTQMPRLETWLRYTNFDIGDVRRLLKKAGRKDLTREGLTRRTAEGDHLTHRGLDDIKDHLAEAKAYAEMVQGIGRCNCGCLHQTPKPIPC